MQSYKIIFNNCVSLYKKTYFLTKRIDYCTTTIDLNECIMTHYEFIHVAFSIESPTVSIQITMRFVLNHVVITV